METDFVFTDKNDLVKYLYANLSVPTQIKVQKTLYLLYAFYGATYGQLNKVEDLKDFSEQQYPPRLFDADFQAWRYGPVEFDVYRDEKSGEYREINEYEFKPGLKGFERDNLKEFIDSIIRQTDKIDDFSLVDRTHQDNSWFDIYEDGKDYIGMDNEKIIEEYKERYIN